MTKTQGNTNIRLNEITKEIQDLKIELTKEIEIWKKTMMANSLSQHKMTGEGLTSRMNEMENRISKPVEKLKSQTLYLAKTK